MDPYQLVFLAAALSLPLVALVAIGRAALCIFRSQKAKHRWFTVFSSLGILLMLAILAADVVIWFIYGVAHTGKDASTDLILLASTGAPIYVGALCIWWLSRYLETRLKKDGT